MESLNDSDTATCQGEVALNLNYSSTVDWQSVIETRKQVLKQLEDAKANGIENSLDAALKSPIQLTINSYQT